jgi:excisionase family DNA binding protein
MCPLTIRPLRTRVFTDVAARVDEFQNPQETPAAEATAQRLLPIRGAAEYLGVSRATIERLVFRGELPIVKVAGSTRYDVEDLNGYIAVNRCRNRKRTA